MVSLSPQQYFIEYYKYLLILKVIVAIRATAYLHSATPAILPGNSDQIIAIIGSRVGSSTAIDLD